jgi:hypothetical protein
MMLWLFAIGGVLLAQDPVRVSSLQLTPAVVATIELAKLKGTQVRQLAWSPDGASIYLMTYDPNKDASIKQAYHFLIPAGGGTPQPVAAQPDWAVKYWAWKSDRFSPADKSVKIDVAQERKKMSGVAIPFGDDLARGGTVDPATTGMSTEAALDAARAMQMNDVYTLSFKGQVVGEWINHPIVPGLTFGWAPASLPVLAFADKGSGKLVLMSVGGERVKIDGTRNVVLPAWTEDGTRLAFLEGAGRMKYNLVVAAVQK